MSIQPPSDIVLDVANAADPAKALAATERLARFATGTPVAPGAFATALGTAARADDATALRTRIAMTGAPSGVIDAPADPRTKAYKGLETLILQNLVETMMPKDTGAYFGESAGADQWRSMMAQRIAEQLSKRMDLGIASKAAAIHTPSPDDIVPASARDALVDEVSRAAGVRA